MNINSALVSDFETGKIIYEFIQQILKTFHVLKNELEEKNKYNAVL